MISSSTRMVATHPARSRWLRCKVTSTPRCAPWPTWPAARRRRRERPLGRESRQGAGSGRAQFLARRSRLVRAGPRRLRAAVPGAHIEPRASSVLGAAVSPIAPNVSRRSCWARASTRAGESARLLEGKSRYNPMSYHNGSVWPHDTALCAAGMARYGARDSVARLLSDMFEAAVKFDMRLPELFCGFERRAGESPIAYPVACLPQAWASGSVFMLLQACLGLSIDGWRGEIHIRSAAAAHRHRSDNHPPPRGRRHAGRSDLPADRRAGRGLSRGRRSWCYPGHITCLNRRPLSTDMLERIVSGEAKVIKLERLPPHMSERRDAQTIFASDGAPGWRPWRVTLWSIRISRRPPCGGSQADRRAASKARRALGWVHATPFRGSAPPHPKLHQ